jgi:hypothetical protein
MAIIRPIYYSAHGRSTGRGVLMITAVWATSFTIALPVLFVNTASDQTGTDVCSLKVRTIAGCTYWSMVYLELLSVLRVHQSVLCDTVVDGLVLATVCRHDRTLFDDSQTVVRS